MNHYPHHIGDYAEATAHLTFIEDAAYSRLLRKYYASEKPLPADVRQVQRLVIARTKEERQAVEDVLREFFVLQDDGWHQSRCDAELAVYQQKAERNRTVGKLGGRPKRNPDETQEVDGTKPKNNPSGSESKPTDNPNQNQNQNQNQTHTARACGAAAMAMKRGGMGQVNPSDPRLQALVDQGVTEAEFESAAREAVEKGKPFGYALAIVEGRRRDAGKIATLPTRDRMADFRGAI